MINEIWEGLKQAIIRPVMAAVTLIHPGKETNMGDLEKLDRKMELMSCIFDEKARRTKIEDEHTRLVSEGRFEEATKILNDLDDNILKNMQKELEMLNAESEEVPDQKEEEDSAAPEAVPETFTREEVVRMLQEMQQKALDVNGFIVGHVSQYWVIKVLIGEKILSLGGTEVEYKVI